MNLTCSGCGRTFHVGVDALAMPFFAVAGDFGIVTGDADAESSGPDCPDLIAAVEEGLASLDAETQQEQSRIVERLKMLVEKADPRWWKCNACGSVQEYPASSGR